MKTPDAKINEPFNTCLQLGATWISSGHRQSYSVVNAFYRDLNRADIAEIMVIKVRL